MNHFTEKSPIKNSFNYYTTNTNLVGFSQRNPTVLFIVSCSITRSQNFPILSMITLVCIKVLLRDYNPRYNGVYLTLYLHYLSITFTFFRFYENSLFSSPFLKLYFLLFLRNLLPFFLLYLRSLL
ncbi:hypothetical protein SAMN05421659_10360 [[Clostridium] fimetarium]|uniref:Uncharacterized protein n=1 Tax=[Clostridium] fimetarium TaxID=99656 RepID=A0A1I0NF07_9FIRM|nr:hypothetical protein SAMN05421659_10360 [[Clostridium] fimetarium]